MRLRRGREKPSDWLRMWGIRTACLKGFLRLLVHTDMVTNREVETRVLVVDDEENISYLLCLALRNQGFEVATATTGTDALNELRQFKPHVVILDVMLPDRDGFDVLKQLRREGVEVPVIFLSARGAVEDRVKGLAMGADDYMVKPFSLEEVVARVEAQLRRIGRDRRRSRFDIEGLVLDDDAHRVWSDGEEIHLSPTEFVLLRYLMAHEGKVMRREQILNHVWQYDFDGQSTIIEPYISNLRRKVEKNGRRIIHTVRGVGYTIRVK
jgi:two-component system, OmpR family, response regulator